MQINLDDNLTWVPHVKDLKKSFANKLELLKRSRFLPKDVLLKFYFSVILPSNLVNYNDKTTNVSFKELKKRLTTREYFKDFIFDGTAVSTSRHRASSYVYF